MTAPSLKQAHPHLKTKEDTTLWITCENVEVNAKVNLQYRTTTLNGKVDYFDANKKKARLIIYKPSVPSPSEKLETDHILTTGDLVNVTITITNSTGESGDTVTMLVLD